MIGAPLAPAISLVLAYLAGSIPFAYLAGRARGVDLRRHGSGNLGATNAVRVLGPAVGIPVFLADILKGFLPVVLLPRIVPTNHPTLLALAVGVAAIVGHVRPIFLLGRGGGKGVATATGVFLALAPLATVATFVVWLVVFAASRYVSLASLVSAVSLPVALVVLGRSPRDPVFVAATLIALFVVYTHRANIRRLRRGEEHRFARDRARPRDAAPQESPL